MDLFDEGMDRMTAGVAAGEVEAIRGGIDLLNQGAERVTTANERLISSPCASDRRTSGRLLPGLMRA